jgi:prepilin-type N-terminal cleavage/methylation domain-containing protein
MIAQRSRFSSFHLPARRGFTLIELLVVIGIIAVLISILLPALNRARQHSQRVACSSNMRQIYTALHMYANDNHNWLPDAYRIYERMWWVGWDGQFLHNKLGKYIPPRSKVWMDPAVDEDQVIEPGWTVWGDAFAPETGVWAWVPFTPANAGEGYYYAAWTNLNAWGVNPRWYRFGKPRRPEAINLMWCLNAQQSSTTGRRPPHLNKYWQVLWMDGSTTLQRGYYATLSQPPVDFTLYVNSCGAWADF